MSEVINGVPRSLLEQVAIELEHDNDRYMLGRELRKLLATAQPAADGERAEAITAEHALGLELALSIMRQHRIETGGVHLSALKRLEGVAQQARAAQPQQAVAVTDEVRRLREALNKAAAHIRPTCGELYRELMVALSTHKTGEEE